MPERGSAASKKKKDGIREEPFPPIREEEPLSLGELEGKSEKKR